MRRLISWAIDNTPAMNTFMIGILLVGFLCASMLRREEFPRFELEIVLVTVPYPGASPDEVESGICQKIEEAIRSVDGIKKITSVAQEGLGSVVVELHSDVPNVTKTLNEIESEIDRIPSFPDLAEEPEIRQLTIRKPAIKVSVVSNSEPSPEVELELRDVVERVRDDILLLPSITVAEIQGERNYQIDVEISETTLREYGLTLQDVANKLRAQNLELPGGKIRSDSQVFLLRGKNKRLSGEEIAKIPLITKANGVVLTVDDLGSVRDEFEDVPAYSYVNGKPGLTISVEAAAREDLIAMTDEVKKYVEKTALPYGYEFVVWDDHSINVNDRLDLLKRNGLQGLVLVFIVLSLFLELRLSFWVALGIPISMLGACGVLWYFDQTLNMLSMFSFLIALGIVVDDAIVIGENIYTHREMGKRFHRAAIDGTVEVLPSVAASVSTTVIAFIPMFYVTGIMGKFFAVMPLAVIAILIISLLEGAMILPCHLGHDPQPSRFKIITYLGKAIAWLFNPITALFHFANVHFSEFLDWVIQKLYLPALIFCLRRPFVAISSAVTLLLFSVALVSSGTVPRVIFPKLDAQQLQATVIFPDGTPTRVTELATRRIEHAMLNLNEKYKQQGSPILVLTDRLIGQVTNQSPGGADQLTAGSHAGAVTVELVDNKHRTVTSQEIVKQWRESVGEIAGAETLTFATNAMGPGGKAIEFKLLAKANQMQELEAAVEECKGKLATYTGVYDIYDDSRPGKWELQIQVKDDAKTLGVPLQAIAGSVRAAYYGEEVMRLQRGRHEVKLMVRYPEAERRSLADFSNLRVDIGDGIKRPINEVAHINVQRGYSEINRRAQMRSITVTSDIDESVANAAEVVKDMQAEFVPDLLERYPGVRILWEGQQEQSQESMQSLFLGFLIALLAMFILLTIEFTSYMQPLIVMAIIPFGAIGAVWGHALMGLPLTLFSVLGMVALTGVVVNDSIVLVDFINARMRAGLPLYDALLESGQRRFRPVLLTSMTTVAGLLPILTETSFQAQLVIPMASSLCFGLMLATFLVLFLVPTFYLLYGQLTQIPTDQVDGDSEVDDDTDSNAHGVERVDAEPVPV